MLIDEFHTDKNVALTAITMRSLCTDHERKTAQYGAEGTDAAAYKAYREQHR